MLSPFTRPSTPFILVINLFFVAPSKPSFALQVRDPVDASCLGGHLSVKCATLSLRISQTLLQVANCRICQISCSLRYKICAGQNRTGGGHPIYERELVGVRACPLLGSALATSRLRCSTICRCEGHLVYEGKASHCRPLNLCHLLFLSSILPIEFRKQWPVHSLHKSKETQIRILPGLDRVDLASPFSYKRTG